MKNDASELIDNYLLGRLGAADARRVEQRAASDPGFARSLQSQREILEGIEAFGDAQMRAKIAEIDRQLDQKGFFPPVLGQNFGVFFHRFRWAAAAALLLAAATAGWWWMRSRPAGAGAQPPAAETPVAQSGPDVSPETAPGNRPETGAEAAHTPAARPAAADYLALARSNWPVPEYANLRSAQAAGNRQLAEAAAAFQKQEYARVVRLLEAVAPGDPNYWLFSEMYAHACFLSGNTGGAGGRFQQIAESGQLPFSERAEWYLLLCRVAGLPRSRPAVDTLLEKILTDPGHPYVEPARAIAPHLGR